MHPCPILAQRCGIAADEACVNEDVSARAQGGARARRPGPPRPSGRRNTVVNLGRRGRQQREAPRTAVKRGSVGGSATETGILPSPVSRSPNLNASQPSRQ